MVRFYCLWFTLFHALLGAAICCPGEKCLPASMDRSPQQDTTGETPFSKVSGGYSLRQGGLPGSDEPVPGDDDAAGGLNGWRESLQGFIKSYILDHRGYSLLDLIRNRFRDNQAALLSPFEAAEEIKQITDNAGHGSKMLFVFGDSLFDAGNNVYINTPDYVPANYPYGMAYFTNATGRISDGRIVPDFIAEFANLPLIPPSLKPGADFSYGANFASAEANVLDSDDDDDADLNVIDFKEQVEQFKEMARILNTTLGPIESRKVLSQAVYMLSIGGNDYVNYFENNYEEGYNITQSDQENFVKSIVGNITDALIEIYELGARKVAFQNVAPIGCLPGIESGYTEYNGSCVPVLISMPLLHNKELYEALTSLADRLEGFKFSVMDYYNALYDRITNPNMFGFQVRKFPCYNSDGLGNYTLCEYPSAYLFFDNYHTTQHTNEQISKLIWDGDQSITRPYTVKQLFEES